MTTAAPFTPRLPPVARGACRAIHAAPPPLPESPSAPPEDAPVEEVLADQAAARTRALEEAIAGVSETLARPRTLTRRGYGPEPIALDERVHVAGCGVRPFLDMDHPRAAKARDLHDRLVTAEAEWEARAEKERHPSRG